MCHFKVMLVTLRLPWKSYKLKIMFTPEHCRFSQGSRSFKTTDDSIKYSKALIHDKWQFYTALLQDTHYAHCPLEATDL